MAIQPHPNLPASLYKYGSPESVTAVLENQTLQFSRPGTFDDDFDARINLAMDVDEAAAINGALEQIWETAYGPEIIPAGNNLGRILLALRAIFPHRPDRAAFMEFMRGPITELVRSREAILRRLCDAVSAECSQFKVLCLSASGTVASMWGAYASTLRGAVLRFSPVSEDSIFLLARPVDYVNQVPILFDNAAFIDWLSGRRGLDQEARLGDLFLYTKAAGWAVQEEWRIVAGSGWEPDREREYVPFALADLQSVVFGTRAEAAFQETVTGIVRDRYPDCRLQQLRKPPHGMHYELVDV